MAPSNHWSVPEKAGSQEALLGDEACSSRDATAFTTFRPTGYWLILMFCNIALFCISLGLFLTTPYNRWLYKNVALKETSIYSPILDEVEMKLEMVHIEGAVVPDDNISPWAGEPSPETDKAWNQFEHILTMPLTSAQICKMGKEPATVTKYEDAVFHLGDDAYVGAPDIFHQAHCLNALRQKAFADYPVPATTLHPNNKTAWTLPYKSAFDHADWVHIRHCTGLLMQHLLCTADTGMLTYNWMENQTYPFPDFGVKRQCKDWRQVVAWRDERVVDLEVYKGWRKPEGAVTLPKPEGLWALEFEGGMGVDEEGRHHGR